MKTNISFLSLSTLLIGISISNISLAKNYICLNSGAQEKHRIQLSEDGSTGALTRTKRAYFSGQREDETQYKFTLGQSFPFGKGSACGNNAFFELTDTLTSSNLNCVVGVDFTYTAMVSTPNSPHEKVLSIHTVSSQKRVANKPKVTESDETHYCYQEDAIPFFNNFLTVVTSDGKGYFLEKAIYPVSFKGMAGLKFHVYDFATQTQLAQADGKDLIAAVAAGTTKAFDANAYTENFDLRKIQTADCWSVKSKAVFTIVDGKIQSASVGFKGDIVEINGKVRVAKDNTLTEAKQISGNTFAFQGYLCFGK